MYVETCSTWSYYYICYSNDSELPFSVNIAYHQLSLFVCLLFPKYCIYTFQIENDFDEVIVY